MPPPASVLPDELLEEIFLRLSPDEPEHLVRALLASRMWLGLLSSARFRGRYRELHRAPPMLGFLYSLPYDELYRKEEDNVPRFVPTTKFRARIYDNHWKYIPWDCRHGRVLLGETDCQPKPLVVWDPMTGHQRKLDPPDLAGGSYGAAVFCAVTGCDHRACHTGPFQVVFVDLDMLDDDDDGCVAQAWVSLPVTWSKPCPDSHFDKWSKPCSGLHLESSAFIDEMPPVIVEGALHFMIYILPHYHIVGILKYDLGSYCLSLINAPLAGSVISRAAILMAMEDGSLGFAHVDRLTLNLWSRQMGSDGVVSWTQRTFINLENLLPIQNPKKKLKPIGSVEGRDIIFVNMGLDNYEINLKTVRWKKLRKREKLRGLIPYMSFYNPQGLQNDGNKKNLLEGSSALQLMVVRPQDAARAPLTGGLPRITEAGEEDLESEPEQDPESESEEDLESESEEDPESDSEEDLESESEDLESESDED